MGIIRKLLSTDDDFVLTVLRITIGVIFIAHGAQKMFGWYGGAGFSRTLEGFMQRLQIPVFIAVLPILAEFFGALGLIVGFLTRIAALSLFVDMAVAMYTLRANGLFMNWGGRAKGEGFEFHLIAMALFLLFMVRGAGALSFDRLLSKRQARSGFESGKALSFSNTGAGT